MTKKIAVKRVTINCTTLVTTIANPTVELRSPDLQKINKILPPEEELQNLFRPVELGEINGRKNLNQ